MGSCLSEAEITRELVMLERAGFGGVEVQPIYASEAPPLPVVEYLSPRWNRLLSHTLVEARRLGLGVDLTTGSGWPWGGPNVPEHHAAQRIEIRTTDLRGPTVDIQEREPGRSGVVVAVVVSPAALPDAPGSPVARDPDGRYTTTVEPGAWHLTVARALPTGQMVKRAGPGGAGFVVDHFSAHAVASYLTSFDPLLRHLGDKRPRAAFTDSYEVYGADWTPALFTVFHQRRGYDLRPWLRLLVAGTPTPTARRVRHDYRQTLRELQEETLSIWLTWCRDHGMQSRLQAHGSPGQIVDLYARADVPETEAYGAEGVTERFARMASSATHTAGRGLCSAEAFTWLDEHFHTTLDRMRHEADRFFLAGINHLVFHGAPSSAPGLPFPGQLFYAPTNVNEHMPWLSHLPALTAYMARLQEALRWGAPDRDLLLYHPIHDVLGADGPELLAACTAHNTATWLDTNVPGTAAVADGLERAGVAYDFASDRIVQDLRLRDGRLETAGATYAALIFAGPCTAEPGTLDAAARLVEAGALVWFVVELPRVYGPTADPRETTAAPTPASHGRLTRRLVDSPAALLDMLAREGLLRDQQEGFRCIRRVAAEGTLYFLKRTAPGPFSGELRLSATGTQVRVEDPVSGVLTVAAMSRVGDVGVIQTTIEEGGSRLIFVQQDRAPVVPAAGATRNWPERLPAGNIPVDSPGPSLRAPSTRTAGPEISVAGPWRLTWDAGAAGKHSVTLPALASWPDIPSLGLHSGLVDYQTSFSAQPADVPWLLDLGTLHESAEVWINDARLGIAWTRPYWLAVPPGLLALSNTLRLRVANLAANRIIDMDRAGQRWQTFYFVSAAGGPPRAAAWKPLASGLLGPVTLRPAASLPTQA
jgi:hypothetical protein